MSSVPTTTADLSFEHLAALEPRLAGLEERTMVVGWKGLRGRFCANRTFNREVRPALGQLLGPERTTFDPVLSSGLALLTGYNHLRAMLPACRGCSCADSPRNQ